MQGRGLLSSCPLYREIKRGIQSSKLSQKSINMLTLRPSYRPSGSQQTLTSSFHITFPSPFIFLFSIIFCNSPFIRGNTVRIRRPVT